MSSEASSNESGPPSTLNTSAPARRWSASALVGAIDQYIVNWRHPDWPIDWESLFGRPGPLAIEIGFGNGSFLAEYAGSHPEANLVGVEISWESVKRLIKRLTKSGTPNVRVLDADGKLVLEKLVAAGSVDQLFLNHPDPWNKARHFKRVLIRPEFVSLVASRLAPGGTMTIATDHEKYAEWIASVLEGQKALESCFPTTMVHALEGRTPTKYEKRFLDAGQPIYYFVWRKPEAASGSPHGQSTPIERAGEMPNVLFEAREKAHDLLEGFALDTVQESYEGVTAIIKFIRVYQQLGTDEHFVETLVKEGNLSQQFGILVQNRLDNRVIVKLTSLGYPRATHGVKRAVWHAARRILEASPELSVYSSNVGTIRPE